MIYILRGNSNNFSIQLNNMKINKNKKHCIYLKSIIPVITGNNKYLEVIIKGIGSSYLYDSNSGNFENNILKYHLHTASEKTIYYPKYELNSLDLSNIEVLIYDISTGELVENVTNIIIVFEIIEV